MADEVADEVADEPIIALEDWTFTYAGADQPALSGIDLTIAAGELVAVLGLTGAGKSTLGLSLDGVVPHLLPGTWSGRILVAGEDVSERTVREMARTVGIVFDDPESQLSQVTVAEEIAFGLENLGVPAEAMPARIDDALARVGLEGLADRSPFGLSGGQQQRLAIAAVLAVRPRVLVLDEATANLDPGGRTEILALTRRLTREAGTTAIVIEHDVEAVAEVADRVVILDGGRVARDGPTAAVLGDVDGLEALGLRAPGAAAFARAMGARAAPPVTVDGALAWLGGRP